MTNIQAINLLKGLEQSLDDYCELNDEGKTAFRMAITALEVFGNSEQLPSVQPEYKMDEWCTDCWEYDQERHCCPRFNKVIREAVEEYKAEHPEPCDDAVSREAVLDMLHQECSSMVENFLKEKINALLSVTPKQRWIPVTLETLPNPNSVVVVCGKKGTWDYGTYRGWHGDIHSWWWKKNTIKHVYWWMYKDDAMSLPFREEGGDK